MSMYFQKAGCYTGGDIRRIRRQYGMTQSEMAAYLNVSRKTVEAWETGSRNPSGCTCRLIDLLQKSEDIPFSRNRHFLDGRSFEVPEYGCRVTWRDSAEGLNLQLDDNGNTVLPFGQDLPDRPERAELYDRMGRLRVEDYLFDQMTAKRMQLYRKRLEERQEM